MAFVPLFCRSHYSPRGVASCADLVRRARSLGYTSLGLCDEATLAGCQEFDAACKANGLRAIFGCRLHVDGFILTGRRFPVDLLIESEQGFRNLVRILTQYHDLKERGEELPKKLSLKGRTAGLWTVLPPDGELTELARRNDRPALEKHLDFAREYFGAALAIGVDAAGDEPTNRAKTGEILRDLADFAKLPCLAAPRIFFPEPSDAPAYEFLRNPEGAPERGWEPPANEKDLPALFSEADMIARFPPEDEAVHGSGEIARRCAWRPTVNRRIIPVQDFERGFDPNSYLFDLVIRGAAERYGEISEEIRQRINREFEEIKTGNLTAFLLLQRQITGFLDEQKIARGMGRGPVVSSVLAYCLGITRIDPMQYHLAAQPLASETETYPPIRIEIPSNSAPKVLNWLKGVFGENHVAQIGRRQEIRRDQMIHELAIWAGMTEEELQLALREKLRRRSAGAAQRLHEMVEARHWKRWRDPSFLSDLAVHLTPRPRTLVPSPGRWTLSTEPLEFVFPTVRFPGGERVTDLGEAALDQLGGPRLEFVPHHLLNLLERARLGAAGRGRGAILSQIELDDRPALDLICRGETLGIPPLENVTVKCLLRKHRPANIMQLLKVKTEASRGREGEKPRELTEELPDSLLSYQLAWFKANDPVAFYAGALSSVAEIGEDPTVIVRAIRRAGIEILPPDINLSGPLCSVFGEKIRLGLLMVRHLGEKALEEILSVRLGGGFNSLAEFCAGVSPQAINLRLLQNLIGAGAFDSFSSNRAQMASLVSRLYRKQRAVAGGDGETEGQNSLFDLTPLQHEPNTDPQMEAGVLPPWDLPTQARHEREALGFSLSADPMARFANTLKALKPLSPEGVTHRMTGRIIRVAGLIASVDGEGPLAGSDGAQVVDLEGTAVCLAPNLARVCRHALVRGEAVLVIGQVDTREGYTRILADGLWRLEDIEEQAAKVHLVRLDLAGENKPTLKHLTTLARQFRGSSKIEMVHYPLPKGLSYRILNRQKVFFCSPFYQGLCKILSKECVELFDARGEPLGIALARERNVEIEEK